MKCIIHCQVLFVICAKQFQIKIANKKEMTRQAFLDGRTEGWTQKHTLYSHCDIYIEQTSFTNEVFTIYACCKKLYLCI